MTMLSIMSNRGKPTPAYREWLNMWLGCRRWPHRNPGDPGFYSSKPIIVAALLALAGCVQLQPAQCPPGVTCPAPRVTIMINVMTTVPVSALPGLP